MDHLDAFGAEDLVEGVAELGVAIMDEESERLLITELRDQLRACWATQRSSGFELEAMYSIHRDASKMKKST